jgi:hypothetical protein
MISRLPLPFSTLPVKWGAPQLMPSTQMYTQVYRAGQKQISTKALEQVAASTSELLHNTISTSHALQVPLDTEPHRRTKASLHQLEPANSSSGSREADSGKSKQQFQQEGQCVSWTSAREFSPRSLPWRVGLEVLFDVGIGAELVSIPQATGLLTESREDMLVSLAAARISFESFAQACNSQSNACMSPAMTHIPDHADCSNNLAQHLLIRQLIDAVEVPLAAHVCAGDAAACAAAALLSGNCLQARNGCGFIDSMARLLTAVSPLQLLTSHV